MPKLTARHFFYVLILSVFLKNHKKMTYFLKNKPCFLKIFSCFLTVFPVPLATQGVQREK